MESGDGYTYCLFGGAGWGVGGGGGDGGSGSSGGGGAWCGINESCPLLSMGI